MRIIAGTYRSRVIQAVPGMDTRPTLDKIKGSVFNQLGQMFDGGRMLDLFAGSGNIGLEALSRGMNYAVFVDIDPKAIKTIKANVDALNVQKQCEILQMEDQRALSELHQRGESFDLVYLDPPYRKQQIDAILHQLDEYGMVNPKGKVVCESLKEDMFADAIGSFVKIKEKVMGITRITIYERK